MRFILEVKAEREYDASRLDLLAVEPSGMLSQLKMLGWTVHVASTKPAPNQDRRDLLEMLKEYVSHGPLEDYNANGEIEAKARALIAQIEGAESTPPAGKGDEWTCILCDGPILPDEQFVTENIHPIDRPAGNAHASCVARLKQGTP